MVLVVLSACGGLRTSSNVQLTFPCWLRERVDVALGSSVADRHRIKYGLLILLFLQLYITFGSSELADGGGKTLISLPSGSFIR